MPTVHADRRFWHDATLAGAVDAGFLRAHLDVLVDAVRSARYQNRVDLDGHVVAVAVSAALAAGRKALPGLSETGLDLARMVATQPAMTGEHMHALLSRFRDPELRRRLVGNRSATASVLSRLLRLHGPIETEVALHPNLSPQLATRLWASALNTFVADQAAVLDAWRTAELPALRRLRTLADRSLTSPQAAVLLWPVVAVSCDRDLQLAVAARVDDLDRFERERTLARWMSSVSADFDLASLCALARCTTDPTATFSSALEGPASVEHLLELLCAPDQGASSVTVRTVDRTALIAGVLDNHPGLAARTHRSAAGPGLTPFLLRLDPDDLAGIVTDPARPGADRMAAAASLAPHLAARPDLAPGVRQLLAARPAGANPHPSELECWEAAAGVLGPELVLAAPARLITAFRSPLCQKAVFDQLAACGETALLVELASDFPGSIEDLVASVEMASGRI